MRRGEGWLYVHVASIEFCRKCIHLNRMIDAMYVLNLALVVCSRDWGIPTSCLVSLGQ